MANRSFGRTIWNLVLALLNATLILIAACLWFAWSAFSAAERAAEQLGTAVVSIQPIRQEVRGLSGEIGGLRSDLASLRTQQGTTPEALSEISTSVAALQKDIESLTDTLQSADIDPNALVDRAVTTAFDRLGELVTQYIPRPRGAVGAVDSISE